MLGGGCSKRMQKPGREHQHFSQNTANAKLFHYKAKRLWILTLYKRQMSITFGFICQMSWSLLTFPELLFPKNHDTKCWCHLRKSQRARVPLIGAKNAANIGLDQDWLSLASLPKNPWCDMIHNCQSRKTNTALCFCGLVKPNSKILSPRAGSWLESGVTTFQDIRVGCWRGATNWVSPVA